MYTINVISDDEIREYSSGIVKMPETISHAGRIIEDGIFCEKIFGPTKSYECRCSKYSTSIFEGHICEDCGVEITSSKVRETRIGHIELAIPVVNPSMYSYLSKVFVKSVFKMPATVEAFNSLISNFPKITIIESNASNAVSLRSYGDKKYLLNMREYNAEINDNETEIGFGTYGLRTYLEELIIDDIVTYNNQAEKLKRYFQSRDLRVLIPETLIVIPPAMRDAYLINNMIQLKPINNYYLSILRRNFRINEFNHFDQADENVNILRWKEYELLAKAVIGLHKGGQTVNGIPVNGVYEILKGKEGLVRGSMLGRRLDYSARSVIVSGPHLSTKDDEIMLPYEMIRLVMRPHIFHFMHKRGITNYSEKVRLYKNDDQIITDIIYEDINRQIYVLANRQPTLHLYGLMGFKVVVNPDKHDNSIKLNPIVNGRFGADFDGDTLALYFAQLFESIQEIKTKLLASKNMLSTASSSAMVSIDQDMIIGLWYATNKSLGELNRNKFMCDFDDTYITHGTKLVSNILEELNIDYDISDKLPLTKNKVRDLSNYIIRRYDETISTTFVDKIRDLSFKAATEYGISLNLSELKPIHPKEKIETSIDFNKWVNDEVANMNRPSINALIQSGARGNKNQVQQLLLGKGVLRDSEGNLTKPILTSLADGLKTDEFIKSVTGSRSGLISKGISTAVVGYLTARIVKASRDIQIRSGDCGTTHGVPQHKKYSLGRTLNQDIVINGITYTKGNHVDYDMYDALLADKTFTSEINLRDPLKCDGTRGICKACYGKLLNKRLKSPALNTAVGILTAHTVSEPATQLTLSNFHNSGGVNINMLVLTTNYDQLVEIEDFDTHWKISINDKIYVSKKSDVKLEISGSTSLAKGVEVASINIQDGGIGEKVPKLEGILNLKSGDAIIAKDSGKLEFLDIEYVNTSKKEYDKNGNFTGKIKPVSLLNLKVKINNDEYVIDLLKFNLLQPVNSMIKKGQVLTTGKINYKQLHNLLDEDEFNKTMIKELTDLFESEGIFIMSIHYSVLLYVMYSLLVIEEDFDNFLAGDIIHISRREVGMKTRKSINPISRVTKTRSMIQHLSLGYINEVVPKLLTDYKDIGYYESDKIALGM